MHCWLALLLLVGVALCGVTIVGTPPNDSFKNLLRKCTNAASRRTLYHVDNLYYSCNSDVYNSPMYTLHKLSNTGLRKTNADRPQEDWVAFGNNNNGNTFDRVGTKYYDRGHFVPNNDQRSKENKESTFITLNRGAQLSSINRGYWRTIEHSLVRTITVNKLEHVHVVTGAVYGNVNSKTKETGNTHEVTIPTYFYKIVVLSNAATNSLVDGMCVKQQNTQYDSTLKYGEQNIANYPVLLKWQECLNDLQLGSTASELTINNPTDTLLPLYKTQLLKDVSNIKTIKGGVLEPDCDSLKNIQINTYNVRGKLQSSLSATCPAKCKYATIQNPLVTKNGDEEEVSAALENFLKLGNTAKTFFLCPINPDLKFEGLMTVTCSPDKSINLRLYEDNHEKQVEKNNECETTRSRTTKPLRGLQKKIADKEKQKKKRNGF
ncbi:mitochondrial nuclease NUC1 [Acrasis kona]|uniref:Mitochondrial nuclease NUC1 n=1 Tax=Acrasis kona TaxID=1008807 RepID=A0AAW2Z3V1_9EUKA